LRVESKGETIDVKQGEAIIVHKGEWVKYSSPLSEGAEYIAVCIPAFSPEIVHRQE
jgi:mannose-6-phosphate isomerase-like protein (cupin superfamily)